MKVSKMFGKKKNDLIVETKKSKKHDDKDKKLQDKLLELEDSEIEALFEAGRITQDEYEYILDFRKKKKARKKSQKEQFEERIRCDNTIISKVVNLGRRFRVEDLLARGKFEEARKADVNQEFFNEIEDQEYAIDDRTRDKNKEERLKQKYLDRNSKGRGRERDSR
ncbi:MAG: hypothetical protein IJ629_05120 [Clostridia bacterium]|nr:hypothetical protein [Clostridia bacterium]